MEFIASFSFLHCQFLPLLTSDLPSLPPSTSAHSTNYPFRYSLSTPYTLLSSPVVLLSLSFSLTLRDSLASLSRRRVRGHTNCQAGTYELRSTFSLLSLAINLRVFWADGPEWERERERERCEGGRGERGWFPERGLPLLRYQRSPSCFLSLSLSLFSLPTLHRQTRSPSLARASRECI